jgi:4-hydroxybenzoate polyprenyltransferase
MLDWLRLIRAAGLVTIASNLLTAILVAVYSSEGLSPKIILKRLVEYSGVHALWVVVASVLLYCTGMIWNDIVDHERDRTLHPERPLPSGRISLPSAYIAGLMCAGGAMLAAAFADQSGSGHGFFACGAVLSLILLYNLVTKDIPWLGSLNMGLIRAAHAIFALLMLGTDYLKLAVLAQTPPEQTFVLAYPFILGIYVFGLTAMSELESRQGRRWELLAAGGLMAGAILAAAWMLLSSHWLHTIDQVERPAVVVGLGLALLMGIALVAWLASAVLRPWWQALRSTERGLVAPAVMSALGGLILLDAVIATSANPLGGLCVTLLIPVFLVARRIARMD